MAKKRSFEGGFLQGLQFSGRMNEAAYYTMLQKIRETERYKELGYEKWEDFCNEEVGVSDETLRKRFETLKTLGPESVKMLSMMGYQWKDIKALEGVLDPEQKKAMKQGVIDVEGKKLHIVEENADEVKRMFDLLVERAALAQKAEKLANQKLQGIDKEHGKEVKAYQKEITDLKAMVIEPGTPEEFDEVFRAVERKVDEIVILISRMDFSEAHKDVDADGPVKAKYKVRMDTMETQFNNLVSDIRDAVFGR